MSSILSEYINLEKAFFFQKFFKTKPGQYGYGDKFLGVTVPKIRLVAKLNKGMNLEEIESLLHSPWHEERLLALLILTYKFESLESKTKNETKNKIQNQNCSQKEILDFYLQNTKWVNNWDLVDSSAHKIVGNWLVKNPQDIDLLKKLANSKNMWEQRISVIATFSFIKKGDIETSLRQCKILISHQHDLMHKAVGWVLRDCWKKDPEKIEDFLIQNYKFISRTTLRYAIEKMPEKQRKQFLKGDF